MWFCYVGLSTMLICYVAVIVFLSESESLSLTETYYYFFKCVGVARLNIVLLIVRPTPFIMISLENYGEKSK